MNEKGVYLMMLTACTLYSVQLTVLWGLFRIIPFLCQ